MTLLMTVMAALIPSTASESSSLRRTRPIDAPESVEFRLPGDLSDVIQTQSKNAPDKLDYLLGVNIPSDRQQGKNEGPLGDILSVRSSAYADRSHRGGKKGKLMDCTGPAKPFNSLVLVRFDGNPDDVSAADIRSLETTFMETYNHLISTLCDDEQRLVVGASAITEQGSELIRNGGLSYSIKFAVDLTCRKCENATATAFASPDYDQSDGIKGGKKGGKKGDTGGYDEQGKGKGGKGSSKGMEVDATKGKGGYPKGGKGGNTGTGDDVKRGKGAGVKNGKGEKSAGSICNCESSNPQFRPPTEREFQTALNAHAHASMSRRYLQARKTAVVDVVELEELPCASQVSEFKTYVAVEYEGNAPSSVDDIIALEQGFVDSYNGLSEVQCDPFFRRVRTATLQEDSLVQNGLQRFVIRYVISGTCRGCKFDSNLFLSESDKSHRQLQSSATPRSPCLCPIFNPPRQPQAEEVFTFNYGQTIDDLRKLRKLQIQISVLLVKELDEVECPGRRSDFPSVVVVDHMVLDAPVPKQGLQDLEGAFITAYNRANALNFNTCDLNFRSVKDVIVLVDGPSNLNRPLPDGKIRLTYVVEAECRGCTSNTDLFDFPASSASTSDTGRALQTSDDQCFCPTNSQLTRGPSSLEFRHTFDAVIKELTDGGVVTTVEDPKRVLEVDEAECSASVNRLKSTVFVDFNADTSLVTPAELAIVEQVFRDSYNDLIETFCDPIFRNVLGARVSEENLPVSSKVTRVRFTFLIDGRCRGCEAGTAIFNSDDAVSDVASRHLAENNLCFCTTGNPERRGAAVDEFEALYDQRIRKLKDAGTLHGICSVENVIEDTPRATAAPISGPPTSTFRPVAPTTPPSAPVFSRTPVAPGTTTPAPLSSAPDATPVAPVTPSSTPVAPVTPSSAPVLSSTPVTPVAPITPVASPPTSEPSSLPSGSSFPSMEPSLASSSTATDIQTEGSGTTSPSLAVDGDLLRQALSPVPSDSPSLDGQFASRKLALTTWYYRRLVF